MNKVNIHEAKTHFSKLVDTVQQGDTVIIAKAGKPAVMLCPIPKKKIKYGLLKGKVKISSTFDEPLFDDIIREFEGD